jgi:hypothetical protein
MLKAAVYLADNLLDPITANSQEPLDCPFSRAFGRQSPFDFFEKPENAYRFRRFVAAMHATSLAMTTDIIQTGNHSPFHGSHQQC